MYDQIALFSTFKICILRQKIPMLSLLFLSPIISLLFSIIPEVIFIFILTLFLILIIIALFLLFHFNFNFNFKHSSFQGLDLLFSRPN